MKNAELYFKEVDELINLLDILMYSIDNEDDETYDITFKMIRKKQNFVKNIDVLEDFR